jgi:carbamoyl-phosphate synthase large subunit
VIECNLRASRSFPFVSKILRHNFIETATKTIVGRRVEKIDNPLFELNHVGVKAPQFSFTRLEGADPTVGVEMASTGEVACLGDDFDEAFLKALLSVGYKLPIKSVLVSSGKEVEKYELLESMRTLEAMGIEIYGTHGTAKFLRQHNVKVSELNWPLEKEAPNTLDYIKEGKISLVVNLPKNYQEEELTNDYLIRRTAVDFNVPLITNRQIAMRFVEAISRYTVDELAIKAWQEYR